MRLVSRNRGNRTTQSELPFFKRLARFAAVATTALTSLCMATASAQDDTREEDVEVVIVTARFAPENVQDLPFTVNVIDTEQLRQRRLLTVEQVLRGTVGVDVSSFGGINDSVVRMRGVGSLFQISMEDSSVVLNLDGVPLSGRSSSMANMDISRVEVLKGPQGTLFGRNSEAGAVNVISSRPTRELDGYVRTELGEENQQTLEAAVGGPLGDTVSARMAVRSFGADGVLYNTQTNEPVLDIEEQGVRASILWEPVYSTSLLLIAENQEQEGRVGFESLRPFTDPPTQDIAPGLQNGNNDQSRLSLELNHAFDSMLFTSLTSTTRNTSTGTGCQSASLADLLYGFPADVCQLTETEYDGVNQDFRLSAREDASLFWVAGLNAAGLDRRYDNAVSAFGVDNDRWFETDSQAIYTELTYPLGDALKLTGGIRYTHVEKDYRANFYSGGALIGSDSRSLSDDYFTGRLALSGEVSEIINLYGVIARGYKSGGFPDYTSQVADGMPLRPATVNSLEVGMKSVARDGLFTLNAAVFLNRAKDDHLLGYDPMTFAAEGLNTDTESVGIEVEGTWRLSPRWAFSGGASYTNAEITDDVFGVSGGDVASGNKVPDVAEWNGLARVEFVNSIQSLGGGFFDEVRAVLSTRYLDERQGNPQNQFVLPSNTKVDLRVTLAGERAEVSLWGDNLLDERNELYGYFYAPGLITGMPDRGRTYGVGMRYQF